MVMFCQCAFMAPTTAQRIRLLGYSLPNTASICSPIGADTCCCWIDFSYVMTDHPYTDNTLGC